MQKADQIKVPTFLKWAGGKQQLLQQFAKKFPKEVGQYVEPFLGGGAILFYILKYKTPQSAKAFDSNQELINVYLQVKNNLNKLLEQLRIYETEHNNSEDPRSYYYTRRIEFNSLKANKLKKAALFIYLNKTCYNGLYRVNSKGEFNVPFNGSERITLLDETELREASKLLQKVTIEHRDFRDVEFHKNETVYFDPPYWSEPKNKGFTKYTNPDFDETAQKNLADLFEKLNKIGCVLVLSNSDTKLIHSLYKSPEFKRHRITVRRMINCDGHGRNKIKEILITNY